MAKDPNIGRKIGNFLIQEKVGSGGMGTVYRAIQEGLDRPVAVKILLSGRQSPTFLKRFIREAKSAAQVNHPNVVQVYTAGLSEDVHFLAMEFLQGSSVGDLLDRHGKFKEGEILSIARQAAMGLQAAARRGLVHRDVKPDNLILDRDSVIKVADFGLAKDAQDPTRLTQDKVTIGTIAYMSPEQIRGTDVDFRSDIYSLGATLFHMATGRPPFLGEGAVVMAYMHLNEPPPLLRSLNGEISESLEAVIHRMMAKDPEKRYASYEELLEDINALSNEGVPTSTQTLEFHRELIREARAPVHSRGYLVALIGGTLALAVVVLLLVNLFVGNRKKEEKPPPDENPPPRSSGFVLEAPVEGAILPSSRVLVTGKADPDEVASLEINGVQVSVIAGRFSHDTWLDPKTPQIAIVIHRRDGGVEKKALSLIVDGEPPRIVIEEPKGGVLHTREASARIAGSFHDDHPEALLVDKAAVQVKEDRFELQVPLTEEGLKRVVLKGIDKAEHVTVVEVILVRDLTKPRIDLHKFESIVKGGDGSTTIRFEVDEPLSQLRLNGESLPLGRKGYEIPISLKEGTNEIRIEAVDLAGNPAERVDQIRFKPDRPPTPQEMKEVWERVVREAQKADPEEKVRIVERYVTIHPRSPYKDSAEQFLERAREARDQHREQLALKKVLQRVDEAKDPFEAIGFLNAFLEGRKGNAAAEAQRHLEELRRKDLKTGIKRSDRRGIYINEKDGADMVRVREGKFLRGLPKSLQILLKKRYDEFEEFRDEIPPHVIILDEFFMYRSEVSNAQFARFLNDRGSAVDRTGHSLVRPDDLGVQQENGRWKPAKNRENHPVVVVSWYGATEYAKWAQGRLPKEVEWEKAASWDEETQEKKFFPWGDAYIHGAVACSDYWYGKVILTQLDEQRWETSGRSKDPDFGPKPVVSLAKGTSPMGCFHMAGNVWEWCLDGYNKEFYHSEESKLRNAYYAGKTGGLRSIRGGCWKNISRDTRTTNRHGQEPATMKKEIGFRVVR
ncbi:MAG: protein kinase domain-containing protein [Planctomycetota bacterium]|jgi:serine/threonine protein kinase/formylglycine-generating enzyme required for sulfatase activity